MTDVDTQKKRDSDVYYVNLYVHFIDWMERQLSFFRAVRKEYQEE